MANRPLILLCTFLSAIGLSASSLTGVGRAQIVEFFDDGDFDDDPPWVGDTHRWSIGDLNGPALQSSGTAAADTIHLATRSEAAYGTWRFTVAHRAVNLSSFNGLRVFIMSDRSDVRRAAVGYYLQFGTNNSDAVSLWRSDGSLATQRVELARSKHALVAGDSSLSSVAVERDRFGRFRVYLDDDLVVSAMDNRHTTSTFFAVWVKHTVQGARSFLIDDVLVTEVEEDDLGSIPQPGEIVINELMFDPAFGQSEFVELHNRGRTAFDLRHLRIRDARSDNIPLSFERVTIEPGGYSILVGDSASFSATFDGLRFVPVDRWPPLNNGGDSVVLSGPEGVVDSLTYVATESTRGVSLERIDPDGPSESHNFASSLDPSGSTPGRINSVFYVDETPPSIRFVEQTGPTALELHFDEPVRMNDLTPTSVRYAATVVELVKLSETAVRIHLDRPPASSSIGLEHVRDRKGNRAEELEKAIAFAPQQGDLAFSEIMFEPMSNSYDGLPTSWNLLRW